MAIDASIYSQIKPFEMASPIDSAQKAMSLSNLGMQSQQMQYQLQQRQAMMDAYAKNIGPDGKLNQQGFLSQLGQTAPQAAMEYQGQIAKMNEDQAKAQAAQTESIQKRASVFAKQMQYLTGTPEDQRPQAYAIVIKQLKDSGIITPDQQIPDQYDPQLFKGFATRAMQHLGETSSGYLADQGTEATTAKTQAETGKIPSEIAKNWSEVQMAPLKRNAEQFGSRSPNAELTGQYTSDVKPIRGSQMAMAQMIDNYKNPSPQGDASLLLNAFKIKFPNAPDVNSLKELSESQAATDQWKQWANKAVAGGLDQGTRDNLMRDAGSTFRANYDTYQGIKERYQARSQVQNVNDPTMTYEPAIEKTYKQAMDLQDKIGPYVPPTERPGLLGSLKKMVTGGSEQSAQAGSTGAPKSPYRAAGSQVSADQVAQYATKHGMKLKDAQSYLKGQGYVIGH